MGAERADFLLILFCIVDSRVPEAGGRVCLGIATKVDIVPPQQVENNRSGTSSRVNSEPCSIFVNFSSTHHSISRFRC